MDFYIYFFDFSREQQVSPTWEKTTDNDYDGSSISEQDEGFMFDIELWLTVNTTDEKQVVEPIYHCL